MRTATEILHVVAGIVVAVVMARLAAWAVPQAAHEIEIIGYVAAAFVIGIGIKPVQAALAADRPARHHPVPIATGDDDHPSPPQARTGD